MDKEYLVFQTYPVVFHTGVVDGLWGTGWGVVIKKTTCQISRLSYHVANF